MDQNTQKNSSISIPGAIIIAGAIIAVAIIWTKKPETNNLISNSNVQEQVDNAPTENVNMRPVSTEDHILGNPKAPIIIVEYSDPSCPFCILFNVTMNKIIEEYGPKGQVAWVYRHYPLNQPNEQGFVLHPNAGKESEALECAAELGGNEKFWAYQKTLYESSKGVTQETPKGLDPSELPVIAKKVGLDVTTFNTCLNSGKYKEKIEKSVLDGINAGVRGTPHSIILANGKKYPLSGALPYNDLKAFIDTLLTP